MSADNSVSGGKVWKPQTTATPQSTAAPLVPASTYGIYDDDLAPLFGIVTVFAAFAFVFMFINLSGILEIGSPAAVEPETYSISEWAESAYNYEVIGYTDTENLEVKDLDDGTTKTVQLHFTEDGNKYLAEDEADLKTQIEENN